MIKDLKQKYSGIFPALLTPFDKNGNVNHNVLKQLIKMNIDKGVKGFYVCGSTGEAFSLNEQERKEIMTTVKEYAPDCTLIAHVGSLDERQAISLSKHAKELGYDAISSVTPFYYKYTFDEIKEYYFRVMDSAEMPMLVYYIPAFSGVNMGTEQLGDFLNRQEIIGVKFTSNDFFTMERLRNSYKDKIVYNGYDEMILSGLIMGADGGIGSTYNFMAEKFVDIYKLFKENNIKEAQKVQEKANEIISILCKVGVMQAEKEILCQMGLDFGHCRAPFKQLSDEQKLLIKNQIMSVL